MGVGVKLSMDIKHNVLVKYNQIRAEDDTKWKIEVVQRDIQDNFMDESKYLVVHDLVYRLQQ
jgi:hypothetical protein